MSYILSAVGIVAFYDTGRRIPGVLFSGEYNLELPAVREHGMERGTRTGIKVWEARKNIDRNGP